MMKICRACLKEITVPRLIGRKDTCPYCGAELRSCLNCRFYDTSVYNQCRESQAERVLEKDRSNFCDYFSFMEAVNGQAPAEKQTVKGKLETLFKK